MFFKTEYVIAMYNNKNSRLMNRIFTQKEGPRGPEPHPFG